MRYLYFCLFRTWSVTETKCVFLRGYRAWRRNLARGAAYVKVRSLRRYPGATARNSCDILTPKSTIRQHLFAWDGKYSPQCNCGVFFKPPQVDIMSPVNYSHTEISHFDMSSFRGSISTLCLSKLCMPYHSLYDYSHLQTA